jgi:glycolate oxidase FAD binding subunit
MGESCASPTCRACDRAVVSLIRPSDEKQVADAVAEAASEQTPLEIVAGGSKRAFGRPATADATLDVSRLGGIVTYEAAELVLTAKPATPLAEIKAALAANRQMLAFEPPDWRGLMGANAEPTLGGVIACNLSGPRRVRAGAVRDFLLGFSAVNGRGEIWKAGGKVVKNVTGYDMSKLMAGAFGTLSVLTEVTLKVAPRPETEQTVVLHGLADGVAVATMARALNTPYEVSGVAHLPAAVASRSRVAGAGLGAVTALRLEGPAPSVAYRAAAIEALLGRGARLDDEDSAAMWEEIGEVARLLPPAGRVIWRLCPTPSRAGAVAEAMRAPWTSAEAYFDWGGGLVWLSLDGDAAGADGGAEAVRAAMQPHGGHATLVVAPEAVRGRVAVFEPDAAPLAELKARIKAGFDPLNVLNRGRIREGR